jgi:hypothetical protein
MLIIGLGHKAKQGKDYVSKYMQESLPSLVQTYSFARELKLYCKEHHDELLARWQLANQTKQVPACKSDPIYGYTRILQWYGTDVARKANPNVWVEALSSRVAADLPEIAVITDVRFQNEAAYVKENGGYLIEVIRRLPDGSQYLDQDRDPNHPSETALDKYDGWNYIITEKDGNLEGLKCKAEHVLRMIIEAEAGE